MQLGMIGLGRMGGNIVRRLMSNGHTSVVYDKDPKAVAALVADNATGASSLEDFVLKLEAPRTAWVMLPAGKITESTIDALSKLMQPGDVIIEMKASGMCGSDLKFYRAAPGEAPARRDRPARRSARGPCRRSSDRSSGTRTTRAPRSLRRTAR